MPRFLASECVRSPPLDDGQRLAALQEAIIEASEEICEVLREMPTVKPNLLSRSLWLSAESTERGESVYCRAKSKKAPKKVSAREFKKATQGRYRRKRGYERIQESYVTTRECNRVV